MSDRETPAADDDLAALLAALADRDEFEVDLDGPDAEVTSDRVAVDTPAGRLAFDALPPEDYGAEHDRHDPHEDVYVNMWFVEGYTVVHTQTGAGDDADHAIEVHEQRPAERAVELEAHGVPERRAEIAALREEGLTYSEIVAATGSRGPNHRGDVSKHLQRYNEQVHRARWLAEHAPPVDLGRSRSDSGDDAGE
jgi:hypothetical protein